MTTPDPTTVTTAQLRAAYDALGLDFERFNSTRLIEIEAHEVRVTRYVLDAHGYMVVGDEDRQPWTETLTIPLAEEPIETPEQSAAIVDANLTRADRAGLTELGLGDREGGGV